MTNSSCRRATLAALILTFTATLSAGAQDRKRVAVLDFEYQTVHQSVYDVFGSNVDIGKGISNMLVTDLVRNGTYSVIERQALDKILSEQNFQTSGRADPSTAAQLGKMLGVDAVIIGAITQFGRDDKKVGIGAAPKIGPVRIGGIGKSESKATVVLDARIIDVQTGEILAVATGKGESKRGGAKFFAGGTPLGSGGIDMSSSNFQSTIIGEATRAAADQLIGEVTGASTKIVARVVPISALVADVSGSEVTISVGTAAGVKNGGSYEVTRPGREIKDPATGRVIRRVTSPVGTLKITEVGPDFAVGQLTGGPAKAGDCVGSCPTAAAPQERSEAPAPAPSAPPAAAPVVTGGSLGAIAALPTGPWAWTPYRFKGTEHFKYNVKQTEGRKVENGYYILDIQPAAGGQYRMKVDGKLGEDSYSSTVTAPDPSGGMGNPMAMGQLMALGPIGMTLFSPAWGMMFMGQQLQLGDGWSSSSGGNSMSVKVESQCQHAGVNGLMTVVRENNQQKSTSCLSPNVALPLEVVMNNDDDDVVQMTLVEFRP
jgi:curli biogenesis system outer membrane secretion channel CsgG